MFRCLYRLPSPSLTLHFWKQIFKRMDTRSKDKSKSKQKGASLSMNQTGSKRQKTNGPDIPKEIVTLNMDTDEVPSNYGARKGGFSSSSSLRCSPIHRTHAPSLRNSFGPTRQQTHLSTLRFAKLAPVSPPPPVAAGGSGLLVCGLAP